MIAMLFMASYVGALHDPLRTPHGLPMAVAGPPQVQKRYASALHAYANGSAFAVTREPSVAAARTAVLHHDVYAALEPTSAGTTRLIVADASGPGVADELVGQLSAAFAAHHQRLEIEHVAELPSGDPRGISSFYTALSWVFAGYLGAIVLSTLAGAAPRGRRVSLRRVLGLVAYSAASALAGALIVGPGFGALSGHFAALWAMGLLIVFAVAFPALPGLWRVVGPWLPTGAATTLVRNVFYFDGYHLAHSLWVLGAYGAVGIVLTLLAGRREYTPVERELALGFGAAGAGA